MKRLFLIIPLFAFAFFSFAPKSEAAWYGYRPDVVTSTPTVASGSLTNFPFLFSISTSTWLQPTSTGGRIQNLGQVNATGTFPMDLIFATSTTPCTTGSTSTLNYEPEFYVSSTGQFIAHISVPTMATGTTIYMCYGNSAVTSFLASTTAVWDSSYKGVWHFPNGTTLSALDSTGNQVTSTVGSASSTVGQIDGAANVSPGPVTTTGFVASYSALTVEAWAKSTVGFGGSNRRLVANSHTDSDKKGFQMFLSGSDSVTTFNVGNGTTFATVNTSPVPPTGVWTSLSETYDGATVTPYFNGTASGTSASFTGSVSASGLDMKFGTGVGYSGDSFNGGSLDEIRISNVARSSSWILTEYNNQKSPSTFSTVGAEVVNGGTTTAAVFDCLFFSSD